MMAAQRERARPPLGVPLWVESPKRGVLRRLTRAHLAGNLRRDDILFEQIRGTTLDYPGDTLAIGGSIGRKEGFGLVYLEAMSFGKPCLGARAGGVPEVINEDVGELVEYGHIDNIADACVRLAQRRFDPEKIRAQLGRL